MSLKKLESRIERLEQRTDDGECDGCNRTAAKIIELRLCSQDQSWTDPALPCPDCGNPYPLISIRYARELLEAYEREESSAKNIKD
ncbi:MAG: hypothetical protein WCA22_14455 [Candidatus Binatus sp.]